MNEQVTLVIVLNDPFILESDSMRRQRMFTWFNVVSMVTIESLSSLGIHQPVRSSLLVDICSSLISLEKTRSRFILSILHGEIPEKYHLDMDFPDGKHKYLLEFSDGSLQV